jgi:DNA-binding transcriptional ArsR family regulator
MAFYLTYELINRIVKYVSVIKMGPSLDQTFAALADPTRRAILARLASGEATVNELAEPFRISLPAISRHLKVLESAALIERARDGQHRRCRIDPVGLQAAVDWLEFFRRFWNDSFDRLDAHLKTLKEKSNGSRRKSRK